VKYQYRARSRAYKKNDNAHVEQKNNTVSRRYIGYERLDYQDVLPLVNHYYKDILCPLLNHFYPSNKLKDKQLVQSKRKRFYDKPMTPYARIMLAYSVLLRNKKILSLPSTTHSIPWSLEFKNKLLENKLIIS